MRKYLRAAIIVGWRIIFAYFNWMIRFSKHPDKYSIEKRFDKIHRLSIKVLKALHVVYDIDGLDDFYKNKKPGENSLIICNHLSDADPIVMMALAKSPLTFVAKKESEGFPFVGKVLKSIDGIFLDRSDLRQEVKQIMKVQDMLKNYPNLDIVIFPEGTRNKEPLKDPLEFKHGSFRPAMKNGGDIAIFSMYGTQRVLNYKCKNNWNPVEIKYLKTFKKEDYKDKSTPEMAAISYDMVLKSVNDLRTIDKNLMKKYNKRHFDE